MLTRRNALRKKKKGGRGLRTFLRNLTAKFQRKKTKSPPHLYEEIILHKSAKRSTGRNEEEFNRLARGSIDAREKRKHSFQMSPGRNASGSYNKLHRKSLKKPTIGKLKPEQLAPFEKKASSLNKKRS